MFLTGGALNDPRPVALHDEDWVCANRGQPSHRVGRSEIERFFRFLWAFWLAGSALWVILMFVIYSAERPSLAQVWLVVSTRDPPLTAFLEDADDLCRLAPSTEAEALDRAPDPMPDYDLLAVPRDQRGAVLQAWTEDLSRYNKRRNDGAPSGKVWLCDQQDYLGAALARSDATRDRREASHALGSFTGRLLSAPLFLLIAGLFLLWSPFRRGD